jgi:ATP-dependent DNA helicase RecQ
MPQPQSVAAAPQEFHRERAVASDPSASLSEDQRALEDKLRAWRKSESEKMGLPQFFVLGTSTLRSIVMERPRTLKQLQGIQGIGPEKLDRFGASILEVCNG